MFLVLLWHDHDNYSKERAWSLFLTDDTGERLYIKRGTGRYSGRATAANWARTLRCSKYERKE